MWKRARKPMQKEQRRAALTESAASLFEAHGLRGVTLEAIAREAGISKANVYRYFESKEEIFLHLLLEDYREWVTAVERALADLAGSDDLEAVAHQLATGFTSRPRFVELVASAASVLERNITVDAVVHFKTQVLDISLRLANSIYAAVPSLGMEGVYHLLRYMHFVVAGMWHAAHPPAPVQEALQRPELALACVDFDRDLESVFLTLARGLAASAGSVRAGASSGKRV